MGISDGFSVGANEAGCMDVGVNVVGLSNCSSDVGFMLCCNVGVADVD